jgi:homoserine O-acetyltransferase
MRFPIVTVRDFVNVQRALLDSLGIASLHAVAGPSMGSLQGFEWAATYPDMVKRLVAVIGGVEENAFLVAWLNLWAAPIRLDPAWNGGDYYGRAEPVRGLTEALKVVTMQALQWQWMDGMFGRRWADGGRDPAAAMDNAFAVEAWLEETAAARAALCDANHFLYLVKANQLFLTGHGASVEEGLARIRAPVLLVASANDLVFPLPRHFGALKDRLAAQGVRVAYTEAITGPFGHLDGIANIAKAGEEIAAFLAQP